MCVSLTRRFGASAIVRGCGPVGVSLPAMPPCGFGTVRRSHVLSGERLSGPHNGLTRNIARPSAFSSGRSTPNPVPTGRPRHGHHARRPRSTNRWPSRRKRQRLAPRNRLGLPLPQLVDNALVPCRRDEGGMTGDRARPDSPMRATPTRSHTMTTKRDARLEGELRRSVSVFSDDKHSTRRTKPAIAPATRALNAPARGKWHPKRASRTPVGWPLDGAQIGACRVYELAGERVNRARADCSAWPALPRWVGR